ncbi:MAG TPA: fumarylacetoacetate hydrolase family protein [Stellaceae bacterium]|nr:fumarylacetoacetate hydrolase family protein [Stellaceae bacterium]
MRLALGEVPSPLLMEPHVLACGVSGGWHDAADVMPEMGRDADLPTALAYVAGMGAQSQARIERALDARADGHAAPTLLKPIGPDKKLLLTEGTIALARSNDQRPAGMVVGFSKFATAFADPDTVIRLPDPTARYDVEAALVAVLGRGGNRLGASAAARAIVGFTLMAEITHRDMFETEARTNNSLYAKNCLGLSPLGPAIWIAGAGVLDPATEITLAVNGDERQRFAVSDFAHGVADTVKAWSRLVVEPGDMVAWGAAIARPRAGNAVDSPIPLTPGDRIEVACAPIGVLRARIA